MADDLAQLQAAHKKLHQDKDELKTELDTLKPAHAELKQMHDRTSLELQSTKTSLHKSQEARVHAEVGHQLWLTPDCP